MTRETEIRQTAEKWLQYYHPTCTQDMLVEAFRCGADWADTNQPQIAYFEHEIEILKSKLQAANDLNTLLTAELEKAKSPWISVRERLPRRPNSKYNYGNSFLVCREGDSAFIAIFHRNGKWYILDHMRYTEIVAPDYWMPIPELQTTK